MSPSIEPKNANVDLIKPEDRRWLIILVIESLEISFHAIRH